MSDTPSTDWAERRRRLREAKGLPVDEKRTPSLVKKAQDNSQPEVDPDLIPQVYERSETDEAIDRTLATIGIVEAYQKWAGKKIKAETLGRTEVIMSCPKPDHADNNPSAWMNPSSGLWFCATCDEGGDMYDIAAYNKGYPVPGYKEGSDFHKLREDMASDFGTHVKRGANFQETVWVDPGSRGDQVLTSDEELEREVDEHPLSQLADAVAELREEKIVDNSGLQAQPELEAKQSEKSSEPEPSDSTDNVTPLHVVNPDEDEDEPDNWMPADLDWKAIIPEDTFLWEYMKATTVDAIPETYHFWHGMVAVGHACGRQSYLDDPKGIVYGNIMLVILGKSGEGKSISRRYLKRVLEEVMPWQVSGIGTSGVNMTKVPASGEALIKMFTHIKEDPSVLSLPKGSPLPPPQYSSVNGLVEFDEFSGLLNRIGRQNAILGPTLMQFADGEGTITNSALTSGDFMAKDAFCSVTSSSQPRALKNHLSEEIAISGFLNRWLFVTGPSKEDDPFSSGARVNLTRAMDKYKELVNFLRRGVVFDYTQEAKDAARIFYRDVLIPAKQGDSTNLLNRIDLHMKRMMFLLSANKLEPMITKETWEQCVPIYEYLLTCYGLIHNDVGATRGWELGETVFEAVKDFEKKFNKGASPRDIQRKLARRKYTPEQIAKTIENLVKGERIELEEKPGTVKRGRPASRYRVAK